MAFLESVFNESSITTWKSSISQLADKLYINFIRTQIYMQLFEQNKHINAIYTYLILTLHFKWSLHLKYNLWNMQYYRLRTKMGTIFKLFFQLPFTAILIFIISCNKIHREAFSILDIESCLIAQFTCLHTYFTPRWFSGNSSVRQSKPFSCALSHLYQECSIFWFMLVFCRILKIAFFFNLIFKPM